MTWIKVEASPGADPVIQVRVHKAERTRMDEPVATAVITVGDALCSSEGMYGAPDRVWGAYVEGLTDVYERDAKELARILRLSLPLATVDRLLVELLRQKASQFRISGYDRREPQDDAEIDVVRRALAAHRDARDLRSAAETQAEEAQVGDDAEIATDKEPRS